MARKFTKHETDFYLHYGYALTCWWSVENEIIKIFRALIDCSEPRISNLVYYSQNSFAARLSLMSDSLAHYFGADSESAKRWKALRDRIGKCWDFRGIIAHPTVYRNWSLTKGPGSIYIGPSANHPKPKKNAKPIYIADLKKHSDELTALNTDLLRYRADCERQLASLRKC